MLSIQHLIGIRDNREKPGFQLEESLISVPEFIEPPKDLAALFEAGLHQAHKKGGLVAALGYLKTLRSFFAGFRAAGQAIHLAQVDEGDSAAGDLR